MCNSRSSRRRPNSGVLLLCALLAAGSTTKGAEPNDAVGEASPLGALDPAQPLVHSGLIGDGAYPRMDVDFFAFGLLAETGPVLVTINVTTDSPDLDPMVRLFDAFGTELARSGDHAVQNAQSGIQHMLFTSGAFYFCVSDASNPNADPMVAGSGRESGAEGAYQVTVTASPVELSASPYEPNDDAYDASDMGEASFAITNELIGDGAYGAMDVDIYKVFIDGAARIDARVTTDAYGSVLRPVLRLRSCEDPIVDLQPKDTCGLGESVPNGLGGGDATVSTLFYGTGNVYIMVSGEVNRRYDPAAPGSGEPGSMGGYDLDVVVTPFNPYAPGEPNDSVSEATPQPFPFMEGRPTTITYEGYLGDGLYAMTRGDRDFYDVVVMEQDRLVTIEVEADDPVDGLRPMLAVYDQQRRLVASDRNPGETATARVSLPVICNVLVFLDNPVYVMVMGTRRAWPEDPTVPFRYQPVDRTIGRGTGTTGGYQLRVTALPVEQACGAEPNDTRATAVETGLVDAGVRRGLSRGQYVRSARTGRRSLCGSGRARPCLPLCEALHLRL